MYELEMTEINPQADDSGTAYFNTWLKEEYPNNGSAFYFVGVSYTDNKAIIYLSEEPSAGVLTSITDKYDGLAPPFPAPLSETKTEVLSSLASGILYADKINAGGTI